VLEPVDGSESLWLATYLQLFQAEVGKVAARRRALGSNDMSSASRRDPRDGTGTTANQVARAEIGCSELSPYVCPIKQKGPSVFAKPLFFMAGGLGFELIR